MKIAVIADDLTGACDSGVQLVQYGLDVSVAMQHDVNYTNQQKDVVIFNTDSRSVSSEEAYARVKNVCSDIEKLDFNILYKKIDSTMRGNIGSEINAVYDVVRPDFVLIAPGHPENGRVVLDGVHYLNGVMLHKTEVANDPKTPVEDSNISRLIQDKSGRPVKHLSSEDLSKGQDYILQLLASFKQQNISYITIDSTNEDELEKMSRIMDSGYSIVWCGSAGLINYLPKKLGFTPKQQKQRELQNGSPVLFVIGSVSKIGREQLTDLLLNPEVVGVEMNSTNVVKGNDSKELELKSLKHEIASNIKSGKSVAFYSSLDLAETQSVGEGKGMSSIEISNTISASLGATAVDVIRELGIRNLFLTGGDTAYQVFLGLQVNEFHLLGELELGVPLGKIIDKEEIMTITKAGNFGTGSVMTKALRQLRGNDVQDPISLHNTIE